MTKTSDTDVPMPVMGTVVSARAARAGVNANSTPRITICERVMVKEGIVDPLISSMLDGRFRRHLLTTPQGSVHGAEIQVFSHVAPGPFITRRAGCSLALLGRVPFQGRGPGSSNLRTGGCANAVSVNKNVKARNVAHGLDMRFS